MEPSDRAAGGTGTSTHVLPPSLVRNSLVQGGVEHGAVPSTHPLRRETKVTDTAENPWGTTPFPGVGMVVRVVSGIVGVVPGVDGTTPSGAVGMVVWMTVDVEATACVVAVGDEPS